MFPILGKSPDVSAHILVQTNLRPRRAALFIRHACPPVCVYEEGRSVFFYSLSFFFLLKEHETKPAHSSIISLDFNGTYIQIRTVQYTMQEIKNGTTNVLDPFETSLKRFSMDCFKEVASELF